MNIQSIGVFCGSSLGRDESFQLSARQLGQLLARHGISVVYGGAQIGLMGELANAALAAGGKVIGVMPQLLMDKELGHPGLSELRVVRSMAERKEVMMELADAFIALPGSIGTLDELFEVWTATQLGLQAKPCGLLNVKGYFNSLLTFLDGAVAQGFMRPMHRALLQVAEQPEILIQRLSGRVA